MLYPLVILICVAKLAYSQNQTCEEMFDISQATNTVSLANLHTAQLKEIITCLVHLTKKPLRSSEADFIWQSIKKYHGSVANIPETTLASLQWVTPIIPAEDYYNITLGNIEVIENFGKYYELNEEQQAAIADRVREDFKEPEEFTYYDLIALRQILCAFNGTEIERIHAKSYKRAFVEIGELKGCSSDVIRAFSKLAVDASAFGPPEQWEDTVLSSIGVVGEYLPKKIQQKINKAADSKSGHT